MKIKKLLFKRNGTITLFAALSMTFLILFFLLIVDISRIFLFSKLTESSTKLAAKSVMSAYDHHLYERYGLFGRGGTEGLDIAQNIMESNISSDFNVFDLASPLTLVPIELKEVEVMYDHYLGNHDELEQQIVEEMKYKAPIDFTLELLESFKGLKQATQKAEVLMDSLEMLEDLFEQREDALEKALSFQREMAVLERKHIIDTGFSSIKSGYASYIANLNESKSIVDQIEKLRVEIAEEIKTALNEGEVEDSLSIIMKKLELNQLERELSSLQSAISKYLTTSNQIISKSKTNQDDMEERLFSLTDKIEENVYLAHTLNTTISIQLDILKMKQQSMANGEQDEMSEALNMSIDDGQLLRPNSFFVSYVEEVKEQGNSFSHYVKQGSNFTQVAHAAIQQPNLSTSSHSGMNASLTEFTNTYNILKESYISPATVVNNRDALINELDEVKEQQAEKKKEYENLVKNSHYLTQLAVVIEKLEKDKATFDAVQERYKRNYERNIDIEPTDNKDEFKLDKDGSKNSEKGLDFVNNLLDSVDQASKLLQAHLYRNEYTFQHFNHLPIGELENIIGQDESSIGFQSQQIEYIMVGLGAPSANVTIIVSEIFLIRLAIRTIEGLIANKHLAHPLLILSASLLHGLKYALTDMDELFQKGYTELSKYAKVNVSYPLYLRFLFNFHGLFRKATLSRIAAVIEHELDIDLMQVPTSTIVYTSSKTKLWMLPSISSLLAKQASLPLNVENGYYEKYDYASSSY